MDIRIEAINDSHFEKLLELFREFAVFEKVPEKMVNTVERMKEERKYFQGFVVLEGEDQIAGYVTFFFAWYTWSGKALYMDDLYMRPAFRGKGLGTQLIHKVVEFAKENYCHKLRWQVSEWNEPAIRFYENLGATVDTVERNCDLLLE